MRALMGLLRDEPKAVSSAAVLLKELEQVEQELSAAQKRKAKFHFCLLD